MRKYLNQHQSIQDKLLTFKTNGKAIIKLEKDKQEPLLRLLYILPHIYIYIVHLSDGRRKVTTNCFPLRVTILIFNPTMSVVKDENTCVCSIRELNTSYRVTLTHRSAYVT